AVDTETGEVKELTKTFYADPYPSHQRAKIESNHRLIRRFIPKGKSFENLTQEMLDLMFSHINSLIRENQGNKTAYELALNFFGQDFLDLLNIKYIKPENVVLKPDLFLNN
ncbi:MAG TPA: IS30 family transposase, partial [Bacilli bacterium]|nr:IS30 family transposase [Bacilli bacterium]